MRSRLALGIILFALASSTARCETLLIAPDRVFTAQDRTAHAGWKVLVDGETIQAVGPDIVAPPGTRTLQLPGATLLPGLIDLHSHLFLHPYSETLWDDQVLKEQLPYRVLAAANHARDTLNAGFTTLRDLGTEGAGNSDVTLKQAIEAGLVPGPRLHVVTRAIVATGAYGPARRDYTISDPPQGAEEASGADGTVTAVRHQAAAGADWNKSFYQLITDQPGKNTWPISTATFILMHAKQDKPANATEVLKFFNWAFSHGGKAASELDYVPMPTDVIATIQKSWGEIKDPAGKAVSFK